MNVRADSSQFDRAAKVLKFPASSQPNRDTNARLTRYWLIGSLTAIVVILAGAVVALWAINPAVQYVTAPVIRGSIARTITASGTVKPERAIAIAASTSGVIQSISCDYNTEVKAGQVCAKIDPQPYQAKLDQHVGALHRDQALLDKDRALLARYRQLASQSPTSRQQAEEQALIVRQDEGVVELDQGLVEGAQLNLKYTDIVSPIDGTIVLRDAAPGQRIAAGAQTPALFIVASDLKTMQLEARVNESDVGRIAENTVVSFTANGFPERVFHGTVKQIHQLPQTAQGSAAFDVIISFDNTDRALRAGMTATARFVMEQRADVIRISNQALGYAPRVSALVSGQPGTVPDGSLDSPSGLRQIWVLRSGAPEPVSVALGLRGDDFTEIVDGDIKPGDQVVIADQPAARR